MNARKADNFPNPDAPMRTWEGADLLPSALSRGGGAGWSWGAGPAHRQRKESQRHSRGRNSSFRRPRSSQVTAPVFNCSPGTRHTDLGQTLAGQEPHTRTHPGAADVLTQGPAGGRTRGLLVPRAARCPSGENLTKETFWPPRVLASPKECESDACHQDKRTKANPRDFLRGAFSGFAIVAEI